MILNVGCGSNILPGEINLDREERPGVNVIWDLNKLPLPFRDEFFDTIIASHIIEHVIDPYGLVVDLNRMLKPGGELIVKLPSTRRSCLGHLRVGHTRDYFRCLTETNIGFDSKPLFQKVKVKGMKIDPGRTWFNLREWILNNIFQEWEYRLKK